VSAHDWDRAPERLIHGKFGKLLREANRQLEAGIDEPAAFERITARLEASRGRWLHISLRWLVPAVPLALAAVAALLVLVREHRSEAVPELAAERWSPQAKRDADPATTATATVPRTDGEARTGAELKKTSHAAKRSAIAPPARAAQIAAEPPSSATPSQLPPAPAVEAPGPAPEPAAKSNEATPAPDCLAFARQGNTRGAEACFLERAQGSGLAAEMALYEVARLRRDVLADADGALRALAEYRSRFPAGSLRREADMSQLELLLQLGRSEDALKQSDELLSSSASGERATELRLLRGHVMRKQSRFAAAVREYELAENAGARGGEATYFRALCLEASGRTSEAATAFTKYLEQPQRPYAEDARRRLGRIKP
jgi:hypothetical protein